VGGGSSVGWGLRDGSGRVWGGGPGGVRGRPVGLVWGAPAPRKGSVGPDDNCRGVGGRGLFGGGARCGWGGFFIGGGSQCQEPTS